MRSPLPLAKLPTAKINLGIPAQIMVGLGE